MTVNWVFSSSANGGSVTKDETTWLFSYPCSDNASCSPYTVVLSKGVYLFELWGAQGGNSRHSSYQIYGGALGGYTKAAVSFGNTVTLNFYIGGMGGLSGSPSGGYNGGGTGSGSDFNNVGAGGGGATDIRLDNEKILVAGGGGGSNTWQYSNYGVVESNGVGGGLSGGKGNVCLGAGQSAISDTTCTSGSLGQGAAGYGYGSGGGGGYYGGSGGTTYGQNGGGGSGFISSKITTMNSIEPTTLSGANSFPKATLLNTGNEVGHQGCGAIRLTYLSKAHSSRKNHISNYKICVEIRFLFLFSLISILTC